MKRIAAATVATWLFSTAAMIGASPALAWDGTESGSGNMIEIERGQTVRRNREVEFFDYGSGGYRTIDIDRIRRSGRTVEIEGTDADGNDVTLEMDGNQH